MKTIREQIYSMFIMGYKGVIPPEALKELILDGLGGVIFFAENIKSRQAFKDTVKDLKSYQPELITSIDQEGGRVERTKNLPDKIEYIPPLSIIKLPENLIRRHYEILSEELVDLGINMNFAPVLDIHTNPDNPIINNRAFGTNASDVIKYAKIAKDSMQKFGIAAVGKHFCGHGAAGVDSHLELPAIDLPMDELKEHILPFQAIIEDGIEAIMVAHVHFSAFNKEKVPASLSPEIIDYLKSELNFSGLVISDDMIMGGITSFCSSFEACKRGIMSGIDMFIFRELTSDVLELIDELEKEALENLDLRQKIEIASARISEFKAKINLQQDNFDIFSAQKEIEIIKNRLK